MSLRKREKPKPPTEPVARPRPQRKMTKGGRVEDRIKRRMSMRYADISGPTELSIPDIPALPIEVALKANISPSRDLDFDGEVGTTAKGVRDGTSGLDTSPMAQEKFDPETYLKSKVANSTESELKMLRSSLQQAKDATQGDLQKSVFNNYEQFVSISKEISSLENDLMELKQSLSEWKAMPSLLQFDESAAADRRRATRSSVADLRTLYATQLQSLHSTIEGSAKFVPIIPGRHVVAEIGEVSSLNPATYKVEHSVHFVLLDDALLVARRRQRRTGGGRLVAEKCWMISDIIMQDVKDSAEVTNVVKLRYRKETHVYRMERPKDKRALLSSFRQAAEELAARKRKEREGEHERRRTVWTGETTLKRSDSEKMPSLPDWMNELVQREGLVGDSKEKAEQDERWIENFADDLTVVVALRQWEEAVELVEDGERRTSITPALTLKLVKLKTSLTNGLLSDLSDPLQRKTGVIRLTSLLERLQEGIAARSTFLAMRTELMRKRIRALRFEGSVELYISDLATVIFTGIKYTADWFLASWRENDTASSLVQWAREQIETFAELFRKQVHGGDVSSQTVEECFNVTRAQGKKHLKDNSLDFSHLLENLLTNTDPITPLSPPGLQKRSPASASMQSSNDLTPRMASDLLSPAVESPRPARPPRNPPPRSRDRPNSGGGAVNIPAPPRTPGVQPRREGMI